MTCSDFLDCSCGVELAVGRGPGCECGSEGEPASSLARNIPDAMKRAGVLLGMTGRHGNVLKVRPPLVFDETHVDVLTSALDQTLWDLAAP